MATRLLSDLAIHHVCGLDELQDAPLACADRVVSILDQYAPAPRQLYSVTVPVLTLRFDDIVESTDGAVPTMAHVEALLEFDAGARSGERLLVHCTAGISRSTAALAVLLAARHPELDDDIFVAIRHIRPRSWPNSLVVSLGDEALGRQGALVAALRRHYAFQLSHPQLGPMFRLWARSSEIPAE
jgi:predicted protein tyrosine phosphatase